MPPPGRPKIHVEPCRYCNRRFKRREHLLRHERTHTQETPFACACGKAFTRKDLLVRHVNLSHPTDVRTTAPEITQTCSPVDLGLNIIDDQLWDSEIDFNGSSSLSFFDINSSFLETESPNYQESASTEIDSFSQFSSGLPVSVEREVLPSDLCGDAESAQTSARMPAVINPGHPPWLITSATYERLQFQVKVYSDILATGCLLPSRSNLARYLETYFRSVSEYLPFLHPAMFRTDSHCVELLLAVAALGAQYRYDTHVSYQLYIMAKLILSEKTRIEDLRASSGLLSNSPTIIENGIGDLEMIQTLTLLISFAAWSDKKIAADAMHMGSRLAVLIRAQNISYLSKPTLGTSWSSWVATEEHRRTIFAAYVVLNMQSVAYDITPLISTREVDLILPGYEEQWRAKSEEKWRSSMSSPHGHHRFSDALLLLLDGTAIAGTSAFANYLLIHGISQKLTTLRQITMGTLDSSSVVALRKALQAWQRTWGHSTDSTLDPLARKAPLGLSSAALLRFAYIRLNLEYGPCQALLHRDSSTIVDRHRRSRGPCTWVVFDNTIILHTIHALSIPVRLGVALMASTKTSIWSVEHSLCSFYCAVILRDWLEHMARTIRGDGSAAISAAERKLIHLTTQVVEETNFALVLNGLDEYDPLRLERMASATIKLWAQIFQGVHMLEVDNFVANILQQIAYLDETP